MTTTKRRPTPPRMKVWKSRNPHSDAWAISDATHSGVTYRMSWTTAVHTAEARTIRDTYGKLATYRLEQAGFFLTGTDIPLAAALAEVSRHADTAHVAFALAGYPRRITFFQLVPIIEQVTAIAKQARRRRDEHTKVLNQDWSHLTYTQDSA